MSTKSPAGPPLELGWHTLCLPCQEMPATLDLYGKLGFTVTGGKPEHGWAVIMSGNAELAPMHGLEEMAAPGLALLNFRGGDTPALADELRARGIEVRNQHLFDPSKWPAEWTKGKDGADIPIDSSGDFMVNDPDGNTILFDTVPTERAMHVAGARRSSEAVDPDWRKAQPLLGSFSYSIRVHDVSESIGFYQRLGLALLEDDRANGFARMGFAEAERFALSLYEGGIARNVLAFHGADTSKLAQALRELGLSLHGDVGSSIELADPSGNVLCLIEASRL